MSKQPEYDRTLSSRIEKIEAQLARMQGASPFFNTGIHPDGDGGMTLDGAMAIEGTMSVGGKMTVEGQIVVTSGEVQSGNYVPGSAGWHIPANAVPEFNDIILRDIPNSMLANPVEFGQGHDDAIGFPLTVAWTYPLSTTITIPSGYTKALVSGIIGVAATNTTSESDYLYGDMSVSAHPALPGYTIGSAMIVAGAGGICWQATSVLLAGLAGPSFTVNGAVSTAYASWPAYSGNSANLDVTVIFGR